METKKKNKGWIKTVIIIFLVLMLALTLLSNTIMNHSLPQVKGQYAGYGQISTAIRGSGTVEANMAYNVQLDSLRRIKSVLVRPGDVVQAGQELFILEDEEDTEGSELQLALDELEQLQYEYESFVISHLPASYAQQVLDLNRLKEDLKADETEAAKVGNYETDYKMAVAAQESAEASVDSLNDQLSDLQEQKAKIESGEAAGNAQIANLISQKKAAENSVTDAEKLVTSCEANVAQIESTMPASVQQAQADYDQAVAGMDEAALTLRYAVEDYKRTYADAEAFKIDGLDKDSAVKSMTVVQLSTALSDFDAILASKSTGENKITDEVQLTALRAIRADLVGVQEQRAAIDQANQALNDVAKTNTALQKAKSELDSAKSQKDYCQSLVDAVQDRLDDAIEAATASVKAAIDEMNAQLKTAQKSADSAKTAVDAAKDKWDSAKQAADNVKTQKRAIEDAQLALSEQQKQDGKTDQQYLLDLEEKEKKIAEQEEKVAKLQGTGEGVSVTSRYGGTIVSVDVVAGDKVDPGASLCSIDVEEKGYLLTISVTAEQAKQIHVGDKASVSNIWWGSPDVTVSAIKSDKNSQNGGKLVEFTVLGDVSEGQQLDVSVGERQTSYDVVVPNSAIREDADGTFILAAVAKSTPLGNRYIATKVPVTVLAKDTVNSAVETGSEYGQQYVIVTATKPISEGDQVRLVDDVQ